VAKDLAQTACADLVKRGWLQSATHHQSHYPATVFAPTDEGLEACSQACHCTPKALAKQLQLTEARFWALRASFETLQEVNAMCTATAAKLAPARVEWQAFIPRTYHKRPVHLHAKLVIHDPAGVRVFYLLNDRGVGTVWQWWPHLKVLNLWAGQSHEGFPPLLVVSTRGFRARAMLALGRIAGTSIPILATAQRTSVIRDGLTAATWQMSTTSHRQMRVNPWTFPPMTVEAYDNSAHAIPRVTLSPGTDSPIRRRRWHGYSLTVLPETLHGLDQYESLDDVGLGVMDFIAHHPACPISTIGAFLYRPVNVKVIEECIARLESMGFTSRLSVPSAPTLWAATDDAIRLRAARHGLDPARALKRHAFFRADAERRPFHALAVCRFFEALKSQSVSRSRATRRLDSPPGKVNEGAIPFYDLAAFESEMDSSESYVHNGAVRYWRPDGYGALRAGVTWTRFWLEMDGTPQSASRSSASAWEAKIARLYEYNLSRRWTLRYPVFPHMLIVTTDLHKRLLIREALIGLARSRSMRPLQVFAAGSGAMQRFGPLARVWYDIMKGDDECVDVFDSY
jgi:hypothetical protein